MKLYIFHLHDLYYLIGIHFGFETAVFEQADSLDGHE